MNNNNGRLSRGVGLHFLYYFMTSLHCSHCSWGIQKVFFWFVFVFCMCSMLQYCNVFLFSAMASRFLIVPETLERERLGMITWPGGAGGLPLTGHGLAGGTARHAAGTTAQGQSSDGKYWGEIMTVVCQTFRPPVRRSKFSESLNVSLLSWSHHIHQL